ncbi:MAG: DEAD/DEAH box helicase [Planctomycetes bacterium]|nr:DEAD/DEAH box helicase [Planctomycetota bacterium]
MEFAVGSLVRARGREWVVLPDSTNDMLVLRPLGGADDEVAGIYRPLEEVESATFGAPSATALGDFRSSRLLRDAVRLGFRSSAGPFRSFGRISVEPRPYQLVPLLLALKQDPVRLLIADDVGIGKTIEAALIARELLDRGDAKRLAVLCPPHLAEQWQSELRDKFHIDAELLLASTASRLESKLGQHESVFDVFDRLIVSMDYIKSDKRRDDFLRSCPDFVIVDEAHSCAFDTEANRGKHQRHQVVHALAQDRTRHLVLVTATPHSGKDEEFRSLLALLDPSFANLPHDLSGSAHEPERKKLAQHLVQRRRGDIRHYMQEDTPFPERVDREATWKLTPGAKSLLDRVLAFARETVESASGDRRRQRVHFWSMLALLRSVASSPAAAAATLRERARTLDAPDDASVDRAGREYVLDQAPEDSPQGTIDLVGGSDVESDTGDTPARRKLRELAKLADDLRGAKDPKLQAAIGVVRDLVKAGRRPIVFCRFVPTAEYVAEALRSALPKGTAVAAVTGMLAPDDREQRIEELATPPEGNRVLVATDCLSEGINLQQHFDAVLHYDLSWNPTRHEQRDGRVDRYGQPKDTIEIVTFFGVDNLIDGIVLDVLLRKHRKIRSALGVSVAVPGDPNAIAETILNGLLLRGSWSDPRQQTLFPDDDRTRLHARWDADLEREKKSRTLFAQHALDPSIVAAELKAARDAVGSGVDVRGFVNDALSACGAIVRERGPERVEFELSPDVPRALRERITAANVDNPFNARFALPCREDDVLLSRTHPAVEAVASYVMDGALDREPVGPARRAGVIVTKGVSKRTTALLVRFRFHLVTTRAHDETALLAEDCRMLAFEGAPTEPRWLDAAASEALLAATPARNVPADVARSHLSRVLDAFDALRPTLDERAHSLADELLAAHRRVREAAAARGRYRVEPQLLPDVLGVFVYLPAEGV